MTLLQTPPETAGSAGIPDRLVEPLRVVAGRARLLAWFSALFRLLALISCVWLITVLALGSGRRLPFWLGLSISILAWLAVFVGGWRILRPLTRRRRGLAAAALLVDRALPDTEERISSAVELSQEDNPAFRGSPELVSVLIRQAENHADNMDPAAVVSGRDVLRWLGALVTLAIIWFILLVVFTPNMVLGMQRLFSPGAATEAPAPVIEVQPGDAVLAQGDSLEITVNVKPPPGASLDNGNQPIDSATIVRHFIDTRAMVASPDESSTLDRTGPRSFRIDLQHIQQSFSYQIFADGGKVLGRGQSASYTVTVQTLPAVADVEVTYTYPAYTRLDPRTIHSHDGAIEALAGSRAKVTIHTTEPVKTASLTLLDDGTGHAKTLPLAEAKSSATGNGAGVAAYSTDLTITKSTQYHVDLASAADRKNPDNNNRPITALADHPPHVEIKLPASASLAVRPDDTVPMRILATDDFGITKIEAIIQIDDRPAITYPVSAESGDAQVTRDWNLNLPEVLRGADRLGPAPRRVAYQFRATDTRDPDPQDGVSARQYLDLSAAAAPLAQRLDAAAVKDLAQAIKNAANELKQAQAQLDDLTKHDSQDPLSPENQQRLSDAQSHLAQARSTLEQAADQSDSSRVGPLAQQVRSIADHEVKSAQEDTAKAALSADQSAPRQTSVAAAQKDIQQALDKLNETSHKTDDAARDGPVAQELERLAKEQRDLASKLAQNPNDPGLRAQQQQLQHDLDKLIGDHPELQKSAQDANQGKVDELARRVEELERTQAPLNQQLDRIKDSSSPEKSQDLAGKQQALNQDIRKFAGDQASTLRQSGSSPPPESGKLDPIVRDMQNRQFDSAARDADSAASALDQSARDLAAAQKQSDDASAGHEKAADQAGRDQAIADDAGKQAGALQKQIQDAVNQHNPPTRPGDPANQKATELANQFKQDAQKMAQSAGNNAAEKAALQNAEKAADSARQAAARGDAQGAQQQVSQAADQLALAAQAEKTASHPASTPAGQNPPASNTAIAQAASQARDLANREHALADQARELAQGQKDASTMQSAPAPTAQQQRDLAQKIDDTAKSAQALKDQTQSGAPALSQKIAQAQRDLEQASQAQNNAADSTAGRKASDAAARQKESADRLADAQEALTGQRPGKGNSANSGSSSSDNAASEAAASAASRDVQSARNSQSQAAGGNASAARTAADQLDQAARELAAGNQNQGNQNQGNQNQGNPNSAQNPGQNPGGQNSAGKNASAQSSNGQNSPGDPSGSSSGKPGQSASAAGNSAQAGASGQNQGHGPDAGNGKNPGDGNGKNSASTGEPGNASPGASGQPGGADQSAAGPSSSGQSAAGSGSAAGGSPSGAGSDAQGGSAGGSGPGGIKITMNGREIDEPKEVKDVGIAPSDWGRLPPEMQNQLLHSAQQAGPPGYRDMIKNYYSRIARMQAQDQNNP